MRALLLLAVLLAPLAAADHVFSHRIVVEGRVIGGDGLPVPGQRVTVEAEGEPLSEPCSARQEDVTDEWGDFWLCYHRHEVGPGFVTVAAGNATQRRPLDVDLRRMVFYLRDEDAAGVAPGGWGTTFHVDGRVWERGRTRLDGVNVSGLALDRVPVNVSTLNLTRAGGEEAKGSDFVVQTDGYGDYRAIVRLYPSERPEDVLLLVATRGERLQSPLATDFHRITLDFALPFEEAAPLSRPGTTSGPIPMALVVGVALALVAVVAMARRR